MMNLIRLLAILLLCTIFCPLYAEDSQTKRTIHVEQAGTLPNLISESEKYTIEELTLTGELNGTDFRLLRDMAGCNYLGDYTEGKLTVLDLSNAKVIKGGEKYVDTDRLPGRSGNYRYAIDQDYILPQYVFSGCKFNFIAISNSVTKIGNGAFSGCTNLTSITIPNSVINMDNNPFEGCSGLTNIIVASDNQIYDSRDNCNAIIETKSNTLISGCKDSAIPNSVTSIGSYAFNSCSGLTSITIPNSVTSIGSSAFSGCSGLTSVTIPNSVTSIGDWAFGGCSSLTNITIPNSVTIIGGCAFNNCWHLTSITIPNSVTKIGEGAFRGCAGLTSIIIPNSVTSIGSQTFMNCSGLTSITVASDNQVYDSRENCNAVIETKSNTIIAGCKNTVVPNSVTNIGFSAFWGCTGLKSILLPSSVTSIGGYAFRDCSDLTSITIPNSVTSIGSYAFSYCDNLTIVVSEIEKPFEIAENVFSYYSKSTLIVPSSCKSAYKSINYWNKFGQILEVSEVIPNRTIHVEQAGTLPNLIQDDEKYRIEGLTLTGELNGTDFRLLRDMAGCNYLGEETAGMLKTIDLSNTKIVAGGEKYLDTNSIKGNGVNTSSGFGWHYDILQDNECPKYVFYGCYLKKIDLPKSITNIGEYALGYCRSLTSLAIPNSVTSIGNYAFYGCSGLTDITIPNSVISIGNDAFSSCSGLTSITIPNSVMTIGSGAFWSCSSLTSIIIPKSVTNMGNNLFGSCSALTSITVVSNNPNYDSRDNCNAIIETKSNTLIAGCKNSVVPNSVTSIGSSAFRMCSDLTSITIPNSVTSIGYSAFSSCSGLTNITIPNSVTTIESSAFSICTGLTSVTIPNSVTSIGDYAFYYCRALKSVKSKIRNPFKIESNVFSNLPTDAELTIPYGTKSRYETTEGWNVFSKIAEDARASFNLRMKTDGHGSIVYDGKSYRDQSQSVTVMEGSTVILTISPDAGYSLANIKVNNVDVTGQVSDNKYTISDFGGDTEVEATFIINSRTIHVSTAGTLPNLISESEKYNIVELTLTGELNGTDFRLLRDMAGSNYLGEITEGRLTKLDLTNAKVVAGGEKYLDTDKIEGNGISYIGKCHFNLSQDNELPKFVFYGCYLKIINLPNSITNIGEDALGYCRSLTTINIPNSVTTIGRSAFDGCSGLTSITIPSSVTSIGGPVFQSCSGLISITVASDNQAYDSRDNCNAIIETKSNTLIACCKNSAIPNSVTSIGSYAFSECSGLISITIPNSVTSIGNNAFSGCSGLMSITIPNSVTSIGNNAFLNCSGLTSITVASDNRVYDSRGNCNAIIETKSNTLIAGCKNSVIPNSVTSIGNNAFYNCSGLTGITIPNSVTSIGNNAFYNCSGLTGITIPNSVTNIGNYAFYYCDGLTGITIPNSVTNIGSSAFWACSGLTSITIPNSVNSIGGLAFAYCQALKSVKSKIRNPFKIESNVFTSLPKDAELTITNGTKSRYEATEGWNVFSKITEEELADGVVFVGKIADDKELDFKVISNNGKTCQVGDGIVCATINLTEEKIVIPDVANGYTVKAIGSNAFQNCSTLKSVTIPNTVTSIGDGAFQGCSGLTSIISKIENPFAINENVFPQEAYSATLYVPLGTREKYLATAGWKKFKEIIEIATKNGVVFTDDVNGVIVSFKVTDVDNLKCQFGSGEESAISQSVTNFSIPSETKGLTVAGIADNAIANCASLLSVTFPETIETVGSNVLAGCTNLAVIKWNAGRAVPDALTSGVNNPNLLLYVKDKSYAPASVKNVVANGTADEIVLKETDGGNNFYCPETFTAKRISFVHNYSMESGYKECRGWETIVLPFDVTSIMSETGSYVVPRSAWTAGDTQQRPFFLYEWTTAGWQPATAIKANIPYIICMPNNENYDPIYQLKGDFEFTGTNVQVYSTDEIGTVVYRNKRFVPNYLNKEASQSMLPLNVNNLWDKNTKADYTEGSAFLRGLRAVRPFEAYMMMEEGMAAPMAIPVFGDGTPTGIGATLVNSERVNSESWYSLDGRKLQGKPTSKGVYILNGRKVVVK